jgi:hypothetical protein
MEISVLALVGIALGTMFFGYFFGLFEGRAQGYKRRKKEEPLDLERRLPSERAAGPVVGQTPGAAGSRVDSLLELSRNEAGQPGLSIDGQSVDTQAITAAQHKRLVELIVMIRPWVEAGAPSKATGGAVIEADTEAGQSLPHLVPEAASARTPAVQAGRAVAAPAAGAPPTSLVAQVDAILQARLAGSPLATRGIRLAEALNGGAIVFVGKDRYDGVADVPDPEVRAAIHAAIAEWEKRYTPG